MTRSKKPQSASRRATKVAASVRGRSNARRRKAAAKSGMVQHVDFQQALFSAALATQSNCSFEVFCARAVVSELCADAVVLTLSTDGELRSFASHDAAKDLVEQHALRDPLARCLDEGTEYQVTIGKGKKPTRLHDDAARTRGWASYLCTPLRGANGDIFGAATCYFAEGTKLPQKARRFNCDIRTMLSAALAARLGSPQDVVEPQQFNSLAAAIPGVVYQRVLKPDGDIRYTYLSEGARELFGVSPQEVLKDPEVLFSTYTEEYRQSFRQRLISASQSLTKWDVEASVMMPDGRRKTTHAIARPERLADGSVLWTGVILDATRAKEAEENLKEANRLVGLANAAKSAFLAKMSHEMRTPLNGVLGMADLLLKTELTQRQMRLATTLCDSAKGLLGIINDVLDLSRIEAGHFKLDYQDFNLRHCVEDAVELCATTGYRKGLEVNLIIASDIPVGVKSDPVRIRQVLINLIGNAIKFTEAGEVVVRVSSSAADEGGQTVVFEVTDTGIGIDEVAIGRLFEPFAQADASISRRFGGTGLGLSITRHLVELLGGTITLTSARGRGTTVKFLIPFEVTADAATPSILQEVSLNGLRTLVIDDRSTNREMMISNLAGSGARVEVAESENAALELLASATRDNDPFRIAIIDRIRPRCSGLHLCRTIRSNPQLASTAMVVLMSANWNANPADQSGLADTVFLSKPARRSDLITAVFRAHAPSGASTPHTGSSFVGANANRLLAPSLKLRVLLVEDNATNIEVAREYLSELECRITVAVNGIEAIAAYDRSQFDIILMDSQMPELDGLSATRRIRESERTRGLRRTPIVAVTANAYDSDRTQALEAGSDDFLSKPFTDLQLRVMLEKWGTAAGVVATAPTQTPALAGPETSGTPLISMPFKVDPQAIAIGAQQIERLDEALHAVLLRSRPAFLGRLLRTFLSSMPETMATLRAAIAQSDGELLRTLAHSLKSSSANVGAKRLSEMCRLLDVKLKLGADAANCSSLTDEIDTELGLVSDALEYVLERLAPPEEQATG